MFLQSPDRTRKRFRILWETNTGHWNMAEYSNRVIEEQALLHKDRTVLILGEANKDLNELTSALQTDGYDVFLSPIPIIGGRLKWPIIQKPRIIIFDSGPLWESGRDLVHRLKHSEEADEVPLIAILAATDFASCLQLEIEDFILKPFQVSEALARVEFHLSRLEKDEPQDTLQIGDLFMDMANYKVLLDGKPFDLTYREYKLLLFLAKHPNRVFTREALLKKAWGDESYCDNRTVDVHIRRLRSKIEDYRHTFIETVRNVGYRFVAQA